MDLFEARRTKSDLARSGQLAEELFSGLGQECHDIAGLQEAHDPASRLAKRCIRLIANLAVNKGRMSTSPYPGIEASGLPESTPVGWFLRRPFFRVAMLATLVDRLLLVNRRLGFRS
jgi:hypothetical protein